MNAIELKTLCVCVSLSCSLSCGCVCVVSYVWPIPCGIRLELNPDRQPEHSLIITRLITAALSYDIRAANIHVSSRDQAACEARKEIGECYWIMIWKCYV